MGFPLILEPDCTVQLCRAAIQYCFADVEVAGVFDSKSSSTFAIVKRINKIRISSKEIGSSPAQAGHRFRVVQNDNGEARRQTPLSQRKCRDPKIPASLGEKLPQVFGTDRCYSDVPTVQLVTLPGST
jgi:hypothetical protein